ncbi:MAG: hypothetical protein JJLCMIEE_02056 [Acidimicrobiales bacterium]|nr:hypothetical protein [Acidimicrobiales bacterium]
MPDLIVEQTTTDKAPDSLPRLERRVLEMSLNEAAEAELQAELHGES